MSHQRQMEWRGYQRLGTAVIASAVRDFEKPTRVGGEAVRARESARAFLAVSNRYLKFWCRVADFDMNAILRKYCYPVHGTTPDLRSRNSGAPNFTTVIPAGR